MEKLFAIKPAMKSPFVFVYVVLAFFALPACSQTPKVQAERSYKRSIAVGAEQPEMYTDLLKGVRVAVVANPTSRVGSEHLVDVLIQKGVRVVKVFAPEHGFRGSAGAGEHVADGRDSRTGLPLISLYGKNEKPTSDMLSDVDVIVFDIQDVGARFYTYISTMHYVMESAAENKKKVVVLDRPNPNGFYIDGPLLEPSQRSFVGLHPIPIVHGCTVGELALMINGEGWLANGTKCDLTVVPCLDYTHSDLYELPVKPSPNLPTMTSVYLYPSLCLFEGTVVSVGRGTAHPFEVVGYPGNTTGSYTFVPADAAGAAMNPMYEGQSCTGHHLSEFGSFYFSSNKKLYLEWLLGLYEASSDKSGFFSSPKFFDKLAGTSALREQVKAGLKATEIAATWAPGLATYKAMRKKYLLYPDFE